MGLVREQGNKPKLHRLEQETQHRYRHKASNAQEQPVCLRPVLAQFFSGIHVIPLPPLIPDAKANINQEKAQPRHIVPIRLEPAELEARNPLAAYPCKGKKPSQFR